MIIHEREVIRDPMTAVRTMLAMLRVIQQRDAKVARLEQDNAAAWCRVGELEERLHGAELRIAEWETAADTVGPVGRPV